MEDGGGSSKGVFVVALTGQVSLSPFFLPLHSLEEGEECYLTSSNTTTLLSHWLGVAVALCGPWNIGCMRQEAL